jgi:cysteine-rich repeat protein
VSLAVICVAPAEAVFLPGRGDPRSECYVGMEFGEENPLRVTSNGGRVVQESCGDACDFHVTLCVNSPRRRCKAARVRDVLVIGDTNETALTRPALCDPKAPHPERDGCDRTARCAPHGDVIRVALDGRRQAIRRLMVIADVPGRPRHDRDALTLVCRRSPRTCCGDGIVGGSEQCDDGNATDGDGCDSNCTRSGCGNGVKDPGEDCDDGNLVDGDGCDSNCTFGGCGNGVVDPGEACDPPSTSTPCDGDRTYCTPMCQCMPIGTCQCAFSDGGPLDVRLLRFSLESTTDTCGTLSDGSPLGCNQLYVGGGASQLVGLPIAGSVTAVATATCVGASMTLSSASRADGCTAPGCLFGPPLGVNPGVPTCVVVSVAGIAAGTVDCASWDVDLRLPLQADIYLSECPDCAGKTTLAACTSGMTPFATIPLPDFRLGTGRSQETSSPGLEDGTFCSYCRQTRGRCFQGDRRIGCPVGPDAVPVPCSTDLPCTNPDFPICQQRTPGAFAHEAHDVDEQGRRPDTLGDGQPHQVTLAGTFCVRPTFDDNVDRFADIPGPAAVGFAGALQLAPP